VTFSLKQLSADCRQGQQNLELNILIEEGRQKYENSMKNTLSTIHFKIENSSVITFNFTSGIQEYEESCENTGIWANVRFTSERVGYPIQFNSWICLATECNNEKDLNQIGKALSIVGFDANVLVPSS